MGNPSPQIGQRCAKKATLENSPKPRLGWKPISENNQLARTIIDLDPLGPVPSRARSRRLANDKADGLPSALVCGGDDEDRTHDLRIANAALALVRKPLIFLVVQRAVRCGPPMFPAISTVLGTPFGYTQ